MRKYLTITWLLLWIVLPGRPARAQQTWQWASDAHESSGTNVVLASDGLGNTIVAGNFSGALTLGTFTLTSAGNSDIFVARLDAAGTWTQAARAGGPGLDYLFGLTLDATKNPIVSGYFSGTAGFGATTLMSAGGVDLFVARLDGTATWTQAVRAGGPADDYAQQVTVDASGNLLVAGTFYTSATFGTTTLTSAGAADAYVAWLSAAGTWTRAVRAGGSGYDSASSIAVDNTGTITLAGYFNGTATFGTKTLVSAGSSDIFVVRLDASGNWTQVARAGGTDSEYGSNVAVDGAGTAIITGYFYGTTQVGTTTLTSAGLADILVARLNAAGTWTQASRAGGPTLDIPSRLALDTAGNVLITGFFTGTANFDATSLTSIGGRDVFLAALSPAGTWMQAIRAGGVGDDTSYDVLANSTGTVTIGGIYTGSATFGLYTVSSNSTGTFVARLTGIGLATRMSSLVDTFTIFPNPASTQVVIIWAEATSAPHSIQVLDQVGRVVYAASIPTHTTQNTFGIEGLPTGLYLIKSGSAVNRLVVE